MGSLALFMSLPLSLIYFVKGHGMMCSPRQRGAYHSSKCGFDLPFPRNPVTDYCAHCLNGGTVATVSAHLPPGGWQLYDPLSNFEGSATRAGLCGDPKGNHEHMIGGDFLPLSYGNVPIVDHWKTGAEVDFVAEIDTNHNGYFEFFLCNLDSCKSKDIDGKCFKQRSCYKLQRVRHPDCEDPAKNTHYECGPIDTEYPGRWYLPCRNTGHVGVHIVGGPSGTMRYKLPSGVRCKHCVVQWYWATANSCAPRGLLNYMLRNNNPFGTTCESDGGGRGTFRKGMATCGGMKIPEEFWSCADVQITDSGTSVGPVKAIGIPGTSVENNDSNDGDAAHRNPDGTFNTAKDKMKDDIEQEAEESQSEKKRQMREEAQGLCIGEGKVCDGSLRCCDREMVCVHRIQASHFGCYFWWSLWREAELNQKM